MNSYFLFVFFPFMYILQNMILKYEPFVLRFVFVIVKKTFLVNFDRRLRRIHSFIHSFIHSGRQAGRQAKVSKVSKATRRD